jgi:UDP-glucose 4-epimerase
VRILVTGSSGHLGEALTRVLRDEGHEVIGLDVLASPHTDIVGSIVDRNLVQRAMTGVDAVIHAATLHKPHVGSHTRVDFVATNIAGTLNLLEEAVTAGVTRFIFTSTTSTFGSALTPAAGEPAAWITEDVVPVPKNIYGVTKVAAESLCELFHRKQRLPILVLRTSRFFPEADDDAAIRAKYETANAQANELLHRRADIEDVVSAHLLAVEKAKAIGFRRYIVSATTPFTRDDLADLRRDAATVVSRRLPETSSLYAARGWTLFPELDRVYVNELARTELGWHPKYDFQHVLESLRTGRDHRSSLAHAVGSKGYHAVAFSDGPYPVA